MAVMAEMTVAVVATVGVALGAEAAGRNVGVGVEIAESSPQPASVAANAASIVKVATIFIGPPVSHII
jgi:hypothetical protein